MQTMTQTQENTQQANNDDVATIINFFSKKFSKIQNFSHIRAIPLYENKFRVNIFTKEEGFITKFKIAHSYFTTLNRLTQGKSISTKPTLDIPNS